MDIKKIFQRIWYRNIYWPISNFFTYRSPIYINTLNIFKIYSDWWKARKVFYKPLLKCYKMNVDENILGSDYFYIETETYNKWFYLNVERCGYKLKYGEIRFENVPYICFIWRNKVKWIIGLEAPLYEYNRHSDTYWRNNDLYWESLLTYLYQYDKDIVRTFRNNIWESMLILKDVDENGNNKKHYNYDTIISCLKPKAAEKIIKHYKTIYEIKKNNEESKSKDNAV